MVLWKELIRNKLSINNKLLGQMNIFNFLTQNKNV
jgi:hypothetical protein